jgi:hypothetical protein
MNTLKLVFFILMIISISASAQMGNNNRMQNQNNRLPNSTPSTPSAADIEKNKTDRIEKYVNTIKAEIKLDDLQYIAIKNDILATSKRMDIVMKSNNTEEDKAEELKAMQEKMEKSINSYLNSEQKEKYKTFLELKNTKKNEKDKKKKKTEENNPAETN